ncbi:acyl-CoA dehydrogenase family protein [Nocardioides caldifontis]|uniref:acyl-CoA dehydrogenase family protein n=1 Tax=Nocardioides caldifontis TaxID=2588938 RepID=UPI0011DF9735|nr:acyl-CoA dehydrogenase family protein [Nocardioides caldifontis]
MPDVTPCAAKCTACTDEPHCRSIVTPGTLLAAEALLRSGDTEACARLLPGIASGEHAATLAWSGPTGMPGAEEPVVHHEGRLDGTITHVLDVDTADVVLVAARTADGVGLFEVAPDAERVRRERTTTMDQTLRLATVTLERTPATRIGATATDVLRDVHAVGCACITAQQVGLAQRGPDMTVASAALAASVAVTDGAPDLIRQASVAKAWCTEAADHVAAETIQLHGGIAITWEHDAHLLLKGAHALGTMFGPAHLHRAAVLAT